jgi:hypothetical protein
LIDLRKGFVMLNHMVAFYGKIESTAKTVFSSGVASIDATQLFWHPDNASRGDAFFEITGTTLTAVDGLPIVTPHLALRPAKK